MSKEALKNLIDLIDDSEVDILFRLLLKFVPEDKPLPDEIEAIERANESIEKNGTVPHDDIDWD
ncbi:MAG: hypothetical protein PHR25_07035 [Clostridia bacterium]|nr:hypothetical protein [Clostridia bacterium]